MKYKKKTKNNSHLKGENKENYDKALLTWLLSNSIFQSIHYLRDSVAMIHGCWLQDFSIKDPINGKLNIQTF